MNAIALLKRDHKELKEMLKELAEAGPRAARRRQSILEQVAGELTAHERMEEEVFYPALAKHREARDSVLEGYEEHHVANLILAELRETSVGDDRWSAKAKVLKDSVEHHIEEEEGEMFKQARSAFDSDQLQELADQMLSVREGLLATS
jgi:hemerythrin-like domain-containing protein